MSRQIELALKIACMTLGAVIGAQIFFLWTEKDPLEGLDELEASLVDLEAPAKAQGPKIDKSDGKKDDSSGEKEKAAPPAGGKAAEAASPTPPKYRVIDRSGIFGSVPPRQTPQPSLMGIAGRYALIRLPDGRAELLDEGSETGGVKVLRIDTNRVLLEFKGKQVELTIFSGMGSSPLTGRKENEKG